MRNRIARPAINRMQIDKTSAFLTLRNKHKARTAILTTKLENRLVKLLLGLQKFSKSNDWPWTLSSQIKQFEQQIVPWEDPQVFERCRFCGQKFNFLVRKHHCRVCGLVVCGDLERECSLEVPANLLAHKLVESEVNMELSNVSTELPLRLCTECRRAVFSIKNYHLDVNSSEIPPLLALHRNLKRLQLEIDRKMPGFESLILNINSTNPAAIRKSRHELLTLFSKYEKLVRQIKQFGNGEEEPTTTMQNIQLNMSKQAMDYLEYAMLPLQALPESMRYRETAKSKLEIETHQNKVLVLQEQLFLLQKQLEQAKSNRDFESALPLEASIKDLETEISKLSIA